MTKPAHKCPVYIEVGKKHPFAASLDWPGWARSGRDEESTIDTILDDAPRYERVLADTGIEFISSPNLAMFEVIEWPSGDPAAETQRRRQEILQVVATAQGAVPPSGPRGGKRWPWRYFVGRTAWHVLDHAWEIEDRAT